MRCCCLFAVALCLTTNGRASADKIVIPSQAVFEAIADTQAHFLIGTGGELLSVPKEASATKDSVWLSMNQGSGHLSVISSNEWVQIAEVGEKLKIEWLEEYELLTNSPKHLDEACLKFNTWKKRTLIAANSKRKNRLSEQPGTYRKCFRTRSGAFQILPEDVPNFGFLCLLVLTNDGIEARSIGRKSKAVTYFTVDIDGDIRRSGNVATDNFKTATKWQLMDGKGRPTLPLPGMSIYSNLETPSLILHSNGLIEYPMQDIVICN